MHKQQQQWVGSKLTSLHGEEGWGIFLASDRVCTRTRTTTTALAQTSDEKTKLIFIYNCASAVSFAQTRCLNATNPYVTSLSQLDLFYPLKVKKGQHFTTVDKKINWKNVTIV